MGAKSSPYQSCQGLCIADEVIRGNPQDPDDEGTDKANKNPFRWDSIELNLPGSENYDPSMPWVYKRRSDGQIASDFVSFVDDFRPTGPSEYECWIAASRIAKKLNWLGIQDAPRKRRNSTQEPGAWAGCIVLTGKDGSRVTILNKKWIKALGMLDELLHMIEDDSESLNRKRLEQIRGFLVHICQAYPSLRPYLIGLHLTIDIWRGNRNDDGWRFIPGIEEDDEAIELVPGGKNDISTKSKVDNRPPPGVRASPRLRQDVLAMKYLLSGDRPPLRLIRSKLFKEFHYGFGDASGSTFGASFGYKDSVELE